MQHEQSLSLGGNSEGGPGRGPDKDREWEALQRDLDELGRQLAELRAHTASLGAQLVNSLEARHLEVKARAADWQRLTEAQIEELRRQVTREAQEAQTAYRDALVRSREAARQMWGRAEPFRQGARDIGEGLARAWSELRVSLGKAAGRLHPTTSSGERSPFPSDNSEPL
jgi:deoxyribodipyrimidine photolyase